MVCDVSKETCYVGNSVARVTRPEQTTLNKADIAGEVIKAISDNSVREQELIHKEEEDFLYQGAKHTSIGVQVWVNQRAPSK